MPVTQIRQPHQPFTSEESCAYASSNSDSHPNDLPSVTGRQASEIPSSVLQPPFQHNASLHALDTAPSQAHPTIVSPHSQTPLSAGLRVRTSSLVEKDCEYSSRTNPMAVYSQIEPQESSSTIGLPVRSSSVRTTLAATRQRAGSLSPASALSSPGVGPLMDLTPLPSPLTAVGSPASSIDQGDRNENTPEMNTVSTPSMSHLEPINFARTSPKKRRAPLGILSTAQGNNGSDFQQIRGANAASHARNRSLSEYIPDSVQAPRIRNIVVSGSDVPPILQPLSPPDSHMHREEYLTVQRGLALPILKPPTPPRSNRGTDGSDLESPSSSPDTPRGPLPLHYEARTIRGGKVKHWRAVRQLGKGTFSTVMLAVDETVGNKAYASQPHNVLGKSFDEDQVDPRALVAVKVCEQGPAGGADAAKVETSLKREVEILKSIHHPSLVQLKAFKVIDRRALLVLNYCAGGDLFDLASLKLNFLVPSLIRRIFAELVAAVHHLHLQYIVHRDIKLENVLVNIQTSKLPTVKDWQTYPAPIVTLTDLGLGRWIPRPPESPLLDTRCGSDDYAAPELLMGQEYDGRATDAWALGVLLYALMEGRLPFDPIPGSRKKSPTSHRIARCEWSWVRCADDDGEWDPKKGEALEGGREVVEGLLARARSRWGLEKVEKTEWVSQAVKVEGGLLRAEDKYEDDDS